MGLLTSTFPTDYGGTVVQRGEDTAASSGGDSSKTVPAATGTTATILIPEGLHSLKDRDILVLTIGEQNAVAAVQAAVPCIAITTAWAWVAAGHGRNDQEFDGSDDLVPVEPLVEVARSYDRVLILGGSDALSHTSDRRGLECLAEALSRQNLSARVSFCPPAVVLQAGERRVLDQDLAGWLAADGRTARAGLPSLFFAAEVSACSGITDSFNGRMIADLFRSELAYSRGEWNVWNGRIWSRDSDDTRRKLASRVAALYRTHSERLQKLVTAATGAFGNSKYLPAPVAAWAGIVSPVINAARKAGVQVQNVRTMDDGFSVAQGHLRVAADAWDRDPHLLSVPNGVVDLRTGELLPHSPEFRMTRIAGCAYDPNAKAPAFQSFLAQMQPDPEVRAYLQRLVGYAATGEAREQKFFTFLGGGSNGKGTFIGLMMDALGEYAKKANVGLLAQQAPDKPRNDVAALAGARLVSISELPENFRVDMAMIKWMTGEDIMTARFLHGEFFQFRPCFTPILDTNFPLVIRENTEAASRRPVTLLWPVRISMEQQDKQLRIRLLRELPGILAWIVEGARQYYASGLGTLKESKVGGLTAPIDPFTGWFQACVERDPAGRVQSSALYRSYCDWVKTASPTATPLEIRAFGVRISSTDIQEPKKSNGVMLWRGIRLR